MRLKNLHTIRKKKDFQQNRESGKSYFSKNIIIRTSSMADNLTRVGFVVSKKVGKAVKRNLVKRRLRSLAEKLLTNSAGSDYIIIVKKNAASSSFSDLQKDFLYCLKRFSYRKNFLNSSL